jgi:hypothetical protein
MTSGGGGDLSRAGAPGGRRPHNGDLTAMVDSLLEEMRLGAPSAPPEG